MKDHIILKILRTVIVVAILSSLAAIYFPQYSKQILGLLITFLVPILAATKIKGDNQNTTSSNPEKYGFIKVAHHTHVDNAIQIIKNHLSELSHMEEEDYEYNIFPIHIDSDPRLDTWDEDVLESLKALPLEFSELLRLSRIPGNEQIEDFQCILILHEEGLHILDTDSYSIIGWNSFRKHFYDNFFETVDDVSLTRIRR